MSDFSQTPFKGLPALKILSVACALACASLAHAQTNNGVRLRTATSLSDSAALVNENSASFISAEQMETTDDEIILTGDAEVRLPALLSAVTILPTRSQAIQLT